MNINKDNYEIYILDYYEGTLNTGEKEALMAFLDLNPDCKAEFERFEIIRIPEDTSLNYDFKESLKKTVLSAAININLTNYREFFIADSEGDLNVSQQKQLQSFLLQNPLLKNDYHLFQLTKLSADKSIVFKNKNQLKKFSILNSPFNRKLFYQTISVAASFLLIAGIASYYYYTDSAVKSNIIALNQPKNTSVNSFIKPTGVIKKHINKNTVSDSTSKNVTIENQLTSEKNPQSPTPSERQVQNIHLMASIPLQNIPEDRRILKIDEDTRNYYTSLNNLLALADDRINNNEAEQIVEPKKTQFLGIDADRLKDQPLAEAGGFLKNVAVLGFTKIEEFGASAKDTYHSIEERLNRK